MRSAVHSVAARTTAALLAAAIAFLPAAAFAQRAGRGANNPIRNIPVSSQDGSFTGSFSIERFENVGNALVAVGDLSGKFANGKPVNHQSVAWPVKALGLPGDEVSVEPQACPTTGALKPGLDALPATWNPADAPTIVQTQGCVTDVLSLILGPLHLDLLGLVVDLNQVELFITAQSGPGALLGNLLCGILGLLDPLAALADIAAALTNLADALNGIAGALGGI